MKAKTLFKEFLKYISLNVCGMIGLSCYILADTFFVSKGLGADGLAALNLAIPVYSFVHGCGLMFGMGGATKYSIFRGQKENRQADRVFSNVMCIAAVMAVIFMVMGILFSGNIAALLGAGIDVYDMTNTYIKFILLFSPAFMMNDVFLCFVRNDGNPGLSMTAMLIGSMSNIALDYIFIFPLDMGIFGAVLATGFAPVISMGVMSKHRLAGKNGFHFIKTGVSRRHAKNIISLGVPSLITEVASGIVIIVFNSIILLLKGNVGVAAYGVVANLSLVVTSVYTGIAQGMQPMVSRAYGYGKREDIKQILNDAVITMLLLSGVIYTVILLTADSIAGIFNSEQNAALQQIAVTGLKIYFISVFSAGFNIILSTYFTSTERAVPAQVISLLRGFFVIIPTAFILSYFFGMTGVWLSCFVTESMVAVTGIFLILRDYGKMGYH